MKVDYIVVGTARSGTTFLQFFLEKTLTERILPKNVIQFYFMYTILNRSLDPYFILNLTKNAIKILRKGRGRIYSINDSLFYLNDYLDKISEKIRCKRCVVILRNPIDSLISHFNNFYRQEFGTFEKFVVSKYFKEVIKRVLYGKLLKDWLEYYDIHVLFYEDLKNDPIKFLKDFCNIFEIENINVESIKRISSLKINRTIETKTSLMTRISGCLKNYSENLSYWYNKMLINIKRLPGILVRKKHKVFKWAIAVSVKNRDISSKKTPNKKILKKIFEKYIRNDLELLKTLVNRDIEEVWNFNF